MNIFRFFPTGGKWSVLTIPDTALLIKQRPFFVPDFTDQCEAQLCYALRINRLGRSIGQAFACRYYDASALTLGVHFMARDLLERLRADGILWGCAASFDESVVVAPMGDLMSAHHAMIAISGQKHKLLIKANLSTLFDELIAQISQFYTLRQGDVFLIPHASASYPVQVGDEISLALDDRQLMSFRVK